MSEWWMTVSMYKTKAKEVISTNRDTDLERPWDTNEGRSDFAMPERMTTIEPTVTDLCTYFGQM